MIRRVLARLLRVAPPGWAVSVFVLFFLLCEGPVWYVQWKFGRVDMPNRFGPRILGAGGFLLGVFRAIAFHPYFRPGYLRWLKATPWTVSRPLPLGPLELVPEDGLALGLLVLLGTTLPDFTSLYIINLFLFGHILALILTFWKTGASAHGYCALLFLGFVPQMWQRQWVDFALLAGIYFIVHEGLWRALRKFPWQGEGFWRDLGLGERPSETRSESLLRLVLRSLLPRYPAGEGNQSDRCPSVLHARKLVALEHVLADRRPRSDRAMVIAIVAVSAIRRRAGRATGCSMFAGYQSPISFWGRIRTFRWIIPGYDQVYVGPICSLAGGCPGCCFS